MNQLHNNEIPICDDVFKYVILQYLTIYDLLKIVRTNKQFKKLIQNIIPDHPYNLHNAIWEGPKLNRWKYYYCNPFILPENPQNYIWVGANLGGADLGGAIIKFANLRNANLTGTNLRNANLRGANLRGANLEDADLYNADLYYINLSYCDLTGANLSYCVLIDANLSYCDLTGANLSYCVLIDANLRDANLRGARTNNPIFHKQNPETILII
jgi:uncharacterized protein YjbI with pentapeptide repeats